MLSICFIENLQLEDLGHKETDEPKVEVKDEKPQDLTKEETEKDT